MSQSAFAKRGTLAIAGFVVINLDDLAVEDRFAGDMPGLSCNVFLEEVAAVVEVSGDPGKEITANQATADWHVVDATNGVVSISRPFTAIRITAGGAGGKYTVLFGK